ncbi:bromodomain-containing protein 4-like [Mangifera indica]|uniref:bromodomain-containing protein 4-like n=1 Tax=Mangifera indica TaxID=29780 RepID=UPI001CFA346B|nr:bromodomain-containing protein 4-like [Mangifera indica]
MNTSQFMDKQIMDLTSSQIGTGPNKDKDFIDLMKDPQHEEEDHDLNNGIGIKKEEIVPSYDFQPIRGGLSQSLSFDSASTSRVWNSADNKPKSPIRDYSSFDSVEPAKFIPEKDSNSSNVTLLSEIDQTMKKYVDDMLHVLQSVSARITQLETRTCNLENSIDDLKVSVGNNHGSTDGKMRLMENILREVQSGVLVLKDKQEIVEAQLQLSKLKVSKVDQQKSESQSSGHVDAVQLATSSPLQSHQQSPPPPVNFPQSVPPLPPTVVPSPPTPQQNLQPPVQLPSQFPQSHIPSIHQRETYLPPHGQFQDAANQQYQVPSTQLQHPPPAAPPHQPYQPPPQPQYSQPPHPPQLQSSSGHLPEETAYNPPQNYAPNLGPRPSQPPSSPPSQQYYGAPPSHMYEPPSSRSSSGFPTGYGLQSGPSEPYPYGGPPSQYGSGSTMKPQLHTATPQSGGSGYPQLPTARVLPQALPTASGVSGGSASPGTGNRVPVDDVIDRLTSMGFPRDHVRATVRNLTENGQSVELNIVLDKLMNDGEIQPQRGWFGR